MDFNLYFTRINELLNSEDLISTGKEASLLRIEFEDSILEAERLDQVAFLSAQDEGKKYEKFDFKTVKDEFFRIHKEYTENRKKQLTLKSALETENLRQKKVLIDRLKEVIDNEEKIGSAFNAYKEIHETWKKIGEIPRDKRDEIQKEYSRLLEIFFYNIKIYKELKDHDVKRNLQLKQDLIFKLKNLRNSQVSLRDLESTLRTLQDDWEEIGPVANEEWEEVKKSYWDAVKSVYEKINSHYEEQRSILAENINKKKSLISILDKIVEEKDNFSTIKDWDIATKKVLSIQEDWKKIGFGSKKENDEVWKIFRSRCDIFFSAKKEFTNKVEEVFNVNAEAKRRIIEEVAELKSSTDWKQTTEKLIAIQKKWKNIGSAGPKWENKLWLNFRAGCDEFFTSKENHFKAQDVSLVEHLNAKNALLNDFQTTKLSDNKIEALQQLKDFSSKFSEIGHVPRNEADGIYKKYKSLLDEKYASIKLDESERDKIQFQLKIDSINLSPERSKLLSRERTDLRKQIEQLTKEITLLENNLGFFSKSKGADQLRLDVEKKVLLAQSKISILKKKISMLPNE